MTLLPLTALLFAAPQAALAQGTVTTEHKALQVMLRADTRECAPPLCGGWFYLDVNHPLTLCHDGTRRPYCYAAELDFGPMGLDAEQIARLLAATDDVRVVFDAQVVEVDTDAGFLGGLVIFDAEARMPL